MSDQHSDRIRLAEAMGWEYREKDRDFYQWFDPQGHPRGGIALGLRHIVPPINPFTDANEDYAVLEWMRKRGVQQWEIIGETEYTFYYEIGDYARAALKVLANKQETG